VLIGKVVLNLSKYGEDYNDISIIHRLLVTKCIVHVDMHDIVYTLTILKIFQVIIVVIPVHEVFMGSGSHCPLSMHVDVLGPVNVCPVEQL
jgi:hypothetical protein